MQEMQKNVNAKMVQAVNYAYNLSNIPKLSSEVKTLNLIKGFFEFYKDYEFEKQIIAPYLGKSIDLDSFKMGNYLYKDYETQLRMLSNYQGSAALTLQVERCMCVQDPFCLNLNIAKSMTPHSIEYFRKCLHFAHHFCTQPNVKEAQLYENLLFCIVQKIAENVNIETKQLQIINSTKDTAENATTKSDSNINNSVLTYVINASKNDLKALKTLGENPTNDDNNLNKQWVKCYINGIYNIITKIYGIDIQQSSPTHSAHCEKHQRMNNENSQHIWLLQGSVDLWTERNHTHINGQTFMQTQMLQTLKFQEQRRQNSKFAVQLNGILCLNINANMRTIELSIKTLPDQVRVLHKKDPLRKFFANLKCSLQIFNIKEALNEYLTDNFQNFI